MPETRADTIRLDKWLWHARFFKTRSLASKICRARKIRVNGTIVAKASAVVKAGDILTFPQANQIRSIKITALGERRGPAPEAQSLYDDLDQAVAVGGAPDQTGNAASHKSDIKFVNPSREKGTGRPTKIDRRAIDRLKNTSD